MGEQCNLPLPYPDELLYSVITRYHLRSNNSSPKWTLREVYGTEIVIPTIDLPSHLDDLTNGSVFRGISCEQWICQHTFYSYFAPFLPTERAERLKQLMKSKDGSGIHTLVGITASTIERTDELMFCPTCYEEDIHAYGEPYWHRLHQLPGVWVCSKHKVILQEITHPKSDRFGLTVLPISKGMFRSAPLATDLSEKVFHHLLGIAGDIKELLDLDRIPNLYKIREYALKRLMELGYVTAGSRIRQQQLEEQFIAFYGRGLLDMLESYPSQTEYSWLRVATRPSSRRVVHPLRLLLLIRFLYGSFLDFLNRSDMSHSPFGSGPWPCLNKAASHYHEAVITNCRITRCSDTGRPVGTFTCNCGFSYSRRGPDQSDTDKFHRGRIKSYGSVWINKLRECHENGMSYRATAKILGVDTNTVIKYAHGVEIDQKKKTVKPQSSKKKNHFKKAKENLYIRVDWEKRDLDLSWQIEEACKSILSDKSKPVRITIAAIGKRIGKLSWLEKKLDKLPVTKRILNNYLETVSRFQIRRVRWAADQMYGEWPLKRWKIVRKAGLRPGYTQEVSEEINRCIGFNEYQFASTEVTKWLH